MCLDLSDSEDGDKKLSYQLSVTIYQYTRRHIPEDSNFMFCISKILSEMKHLSLEYKIP